MKSHSLLLSLLNPKMSLLNLKMTLWNLKMSLCHPKYMSCCPAVMPSSSYHGPLIMNQFKITPILSTVENQGNPGMGFNEKVYNGDYGFSSFTASDK